MIRELQRRPFVRPLFLWITGILLQLTFSYNYLSILFLLYPCLLLLSAVFLNRKMGATCCYSARWIWGAAFACLLLALSVQVTEWKQNRPAKQTAILQLAGEKQTELVDAFDSLHLPDEEKSVLATITLGYRKGMNRETRKRFSVAGVAHILAVSGFHVAIVCGFISFLLSFFPRYGIWKWLKYLSTLVLLWGFICITGLAASAVRAGLMLSLYLTGKALRRNADSYNTLAAAAFGMLVYNPLYLFDVGFQLSYIAVFSILYIQPMLRRCIVVKNPLLAVPWDLLTVTVAAQIGTSLLCCYYFGQVSSVFLFTNLPLVIIAMLLVPLSLLWLGMPHWLPGLEVLQQVVETLAGWMVKIVDLFSHVPGAAFTFRLDFSDMLIGYGILFSVMASIRKYTPKYLLLWLFLLLIKLFAELIKRYYAFGI